MICLTGDLVWSGEEAQYLNIAEQIKRLLAISGCPLEQLFIVPGNHDLQDFCKHPPDNEDLFKKIYEDEPKADINREILHQYEKYQGFLAKLDNYRRNLSQLGCQSLSWQVVNGEIKPWYAVRVEPANLIVIGLNSPLFTCEKYHHRGEIKIGLRQFYDACQYIQPQDYEQILVLIHHPLDWLDEKEMEDLENELFKKHVIYLCGHKHRHREYQSKTPDDQIMLRFGGGSIFGDNGSEDGYNSFEIISINFRDLKVGLSLYTWDPAIKQWGPRVQNNSLDLPCAMRKKILARGGQNRQQMPLNSI